MNSLLAGVCRFTFSALFGGVISLLLFCTVGSSAYLAEAFWGGFWKHLLWVIPICWGVLGIFFFDQMLDCGSSLIDGTFTRND